MIEASEGMRSMRSWPFGKTAFDISSFAAISGKSHEGMERANAPYLPLLNLRIRCS